ncbi:LacI family DNA-binding transcriptional regulator [Kaistia dalseonensis]|uniref:LacI family gluconate utilization system Gnt-I transcriptional repressor n=1 Tax=Kaistia dalseonensis TaxID=410840 RepID=A0ABU0H2V5_9HYPH|nr:LacI family DNA-binding transcriptional regulator [Kaistia dalseonensis]MCX5494064.1 LacI family DNA-binding transcriptional regulator [Kaistia dalseonensis]MDQ0436642.1 LacI family gluconate utilization system Gnt-I transcriptional repressor [Kaistia dalseonensis]
MVKPPSGPGPERPRRLGIKEIARRAGVAPMTVSRALNDPEKVSPDTRARILELVEREGFIPNQLASSMRSGRRIIGTMVPPLINSGIAEQVQGMSDVCHASGHQLLLIQGDFTPDAEENAIRALLGWQPAGLILQAFVQSPAARQLLQAGTAPIVEISEVRGHEPLDMAVGVSNFETAYAMTSHLVDKGYRRIGFVSTPVHGNDRLQQRRIGYRQALLDRGHRYEAPLEVELPITPAGGADAVQMLTEIDPAVDVIFCSSDTLAIGAVQECHRRGWKIPDRLAIAGYGDVDLAVQLFPALTTLRVNRYAMGRRAVEQLLRRLHGETDVPRIETLGFEIIDRESA